MICPKCKSNISDESKFCSNCGTVIVSNNVQETSNSISTKRNSSKIIKLLIAIVLCIALIVSGGCFLYYQIGLSDRVGEFENYVNDGRYSDASAYYSSNENDDAFTKRANRFVKNKYKQAVKDVNDELEIALFNSGLLTDKYISELEQTIKNKVEKAENEYIEKSIVYDDLEAQIGKYKKYKNDKISDLVNDTISKAESLKKSRESFEKGIKSLDEKQYRDALENLSSVIAEDENYSSAQEKIQEIVPLYKQEVMEKTNQNVASNNYYAALSELKSLQKYCSDQDVSDKISDIEKQKSDYDAEQDRIQIQSYKDNQEVEVISQRVWNDGYHITNMKASVTVKNNSDKIAKDVYYSILTFDSNGLPVDVEYSIYMGDKSNDYRCGYKSANVLPGQTYGDGWKVDISDKCQKVKACVIKVTYTDGTTWDNPYFEYWLEDNYASY
ncbi:MAG: zinc-ribbon domain-containing protein [Lachnospiraceae bacterium]|nr:zinc-ribbon domain-containing protein [Lachnospiraceae bacterium]